VLTSEELSELKGQKEECQNSDEWEMGTHGKCNEVDRVKTGQQDDKARYCILKVLNNRGQHLELGKNWSNHLDGPHPRAQESTSVAPGCGTWPSIESAL
jgi:hypothetical protein